MYHKYPVKSYIFEPIKMKGKGKRSFRAPGRQQVQFVKGQGLRSFLTIGRKTRLNYRGQGKQKRRRRRYHCCTMKGKRQLFSDWALKLDRL